MVWLEVETKVPLKDSEVEDLRKRIKKIARFSKKGKKSDDYFAIKAKGYPKKLSESELPTDTTKSISKNG